MISIILDPWLLGLEPGNENAELYIERLTSISDSVHDGFLKFEISAEASSLLEKDGIYPLTAQLPAAQWPQRADVYKLVGYLLDKTPKLEDCGISDVLVESIEYSPNILNGFSSEHNDHVDKIAAFAVLLANSKSAKERAILTRRMPGGGRIECSSNVSIVEAAASLLLSPGIFRAGLTCGDNQNDLLAAFGHEGFLQIREVKGAICLAHTTRTNQSHCPLIPRDWSIGSSFLDSVNQCNLFSNPARLNALIRTCVDVICDDNLRDTHWIRQSSGGESPQVVRHSDGSKAWRIDIDDELHLHYWKTSTGPEFSNVVMHKNMRIIQN